MVLDAVVVMVVVIVVVVVDEDTAGYGGYVDEDMVVGQQLINRVRKKCPTSSEASLKKHFCHPVSQLDSFSIASSLATGLALT